MTGDQFSILDAIDRARHLAAIEVHARRSDPDTSQAAAAELRKDQSKLQRSVAVAVGIISAHGPLSDFQIRARWGTHWGGPFSDSLPCKARHWARQAGLVKHEGYGKHQGRKVRLWAVGRDADFLADQSLRCPHCHGTGRVEA